MILGIHIALALISLFYSTYVAVIRSQKKLKIVYLLMLGTFTSGALLSLERDVNIMQVCITGLAYTGFVFVSIVLTKRKIASIKPF